MTLGSRCGLINGRSYRHAGLRTQYQEGKQPVDILFQCEHVVAPKAPFEGMPIDL